MSAFQIHACITIRTRSQKREEVVDVFRKGNFELLALTLTKSKWCGVNGIIVGIQEKERAREGMAVLMKN